MKIFKTIILCSTLLVFNSCQNSKSENEKIPGIILENMDTSVDPKDDFYNYVNGNWMKTNTIPDDESRWGGFGVLRKTTRQDVLEIIKTAQINDNYKEGSDQKKALLIFETKLDTIARNKAGIKPIQHLLDAIEAITNIDELQTVYATITGISAPFAGIGANPDLNDSSVNTAWVFPGGLGLQRDYYIDQDDKTKDIRKDYLKHVSKMFQFIGYNATDADNAAILVLDLETKLAEPRLDKVQSRDIRNFNNPMTIDELESLTPSMNWNKLVLDLGIKKSLDQVLVMQPKYMEELNNVLENTSINDLKTLMKWSTIDNSANYLTTEIEKTNWDFYSKRLYGSKAQRPAEERALGTVNSSVGEAIGQLYVDAKFPPEAKLKAEKMIANVIEAFQIRIQNLDWMSEITKTKAIEKLDKFTVKIAYPDKWKDYSELEINKGNSFAENMFAVSKWNFNQNISEIGKPVDKSEWGMSPQTVNAYFNPLNNEIVFPAAILQPPFYNYTADEAVNYGGIGAVIGHEISHAFDDSGARFDGDGNVNNWWTESDLEEFEKRGNSLAEQYSSLEVLEGVFINGKFTLGENIGDLGGVLGAYDGLQLHIKENGRPEPIDGFSAEERFFMSWATVWRTLIREDALRSQITTDPHSPGYNRATQPLKNVDAFYEVFGVKEGDNMYIAPENRVRIW
mgnify:FL=1